MKSHIYNKLVKGIIFFVLLFQAVNVLGQNSATEGKDFYVSFTQNYLYLTDDASPSLQIRYVVTKTCRITTQYGDGTYLDNNVQYTPGVYTKSLDKAKCYNEAAVGTPSYKSNRRVRVTSTENIGVFAISLADATTDATTVLPTTALGNKYTIISHDGLDDLDEKFSNRIQVIAPENGTIFTIKNQAGAVVANNITLSAGELYVFNSSPSDLSGYTVESNFNVAVFSDLGCGQQVADGGLDFNFEQMWPSNTAGKNYFIWNFSPLYADKVKILALEDGTKIEKTKNDGSGGIETINLAKHQQHNFFLNPSGVFINNSIAPIRLTSNKPIIVEQILGYAPSIKWLAPLEQTITEAIISPFIPTGSSVINKHFMHVMIPSGSADKMIVKETRAGVVTTPTLTFFTNKSDPNYLIASREYPKTDDVLIELKNPAGFIAYMAGYGPAESYIFTAGAGAFNLQSYFTVGTKTQPHNDTHYTATSGITHYFQDADDISIKRTIEKPFNMVQWLVNGTQYTGFTDNTNATNSFLLPASKLKAGENEISMSVRFTGTSADSVYTGKVWLSEVSSYPDNVLDPNCVKEAEAAVWGIGESLPMNRTDLVHNFAPLMVGNIDGDAAGTIEIVGLSPNTTADNGYESNGISIFNYENGRIRLKRRFSITANGGSSTPSFGTMAMARYNNKGYIVLAGTDRKLYAYSPDGTRHWVSDNVVASSEMYINNVNIADFDGDGIPEVYVNNNIYSLATGKFICGGGANNMGYTVTGGFPMAIDMDNDGKLELVAGTQIYKVDIPNKIMSVIPNLILGDSKLPANAVRDGITQVVDIDNDGILEVVVTSLSASGRVVCYVWKPLPGGKSVLMGSYLVPATGVAYFGVPMIGNIDNDPYPEIVFITNGSVLNMYALKLNPSAAMGNKLNLKWTLPHTDVSGCTGMSLFDFNLDGTAEIVYRDQTQLRIINGSGSSAVIVENGLFDNVTSATLREFPVIADIDGDGQAEIVINSGVDDLTKMNGYVRVFKSSGTTWAPARSVWNQYNYNAVNVNDDLTIPAKQFPITTKFRGADKTANTADDIRLFNNFRQQQTFVDKNGLAYMNLANAKLVDENNMKYSYDTSLDRLTITDLKIENSGSASLKAPIKISVFKDAVSSTNKLTTYDFNVSIDPGKDATASFHIDNIKDKMPINKLIIRVNDKGDGLNYQEVCDSCCNKNNNDEILLNVDFSNVAWADAYRKCLDNSVNFDASNTLPGSSITYQWLRPNGGVLANTRTASIGSLTLNDGGEYVFKANKVNNYLTISHKLPFLSVADTVMTWRKDAADTNWNNINNWKDHTGANLKAVPAPCTTVHLPSESNHYPSLDNKTKTDLYGTPVTNDIYFHYGSHLGFPHKLTYNRAFVHYNLRYYNTLTPTSGMQPGQNVESGNKYITRNQYHLLAAPLKSMVSGDFNFGGYPYTWQTLYNTTTPINSSITVDALTQPFPTNSYRLKNSNNAFALKVAQFENAGAHTVGYNNHRHLESLKGIIEMPYFQNSSKASSHPMHQYDPFSLTSSLFYFDTKTLQQLNVVDTVKRSFESYRFVFDGELVTRNISGTNVPCYPLTINLPAGHTKQVMIGNPFMSTMNMDKFKKANNTTLSGTTYKTFDGIAWHTKLYTTATDTIKPLQAFVVTLSNTGATTLYFPLEGVYGVTSSELTRSEVLSIQQPLLSIKAHSHDYISPAAQLYYGQYSYQELKTVHPESHMIAEPYFLDPATRKAHVWHTLSLGNTVIPIGVKSSDTTNPITLEFSNIQSLATIYGMTPYLVDSYLGTTHNLLSSPRYIYTQRSMAQEAYYTDDNRFYIRLGEVATYQNHAINITLDGRTLTLHSTKPLLSYALYDLNGRQLLAQPLSSVTHYQATLSLPGGVYIVKTQATDGVYETQKIMIK